MNPKGTIYDVVDKQRAALLAREYDAVKRIVRAYETAEVRVEKSIRLFQAKIEAAAGLEPSLAWYYQEARLENILREIRGHLDEFSKDALEFASTGRADAYQLGAVHALRLAEAQVIGDVAGLHAGAFESASALLASGSPLKTLFDEIGPTATVAARGLFAQAVAEGWNPRKLGRAMTNEIDNLAKLRAVLIARTEMIRNYRIANSQVYARNADVLRGWRWMAAKTPATCAMCLALDGEIFPTSTTLSSHPACRCSMLPLPKTDFGGPQPQLGEDYFQSLSEGEQNRILGKGKAALYRDGKMTLKDNVRWNDHPDWGRSPAPRRLGDLVAKSASGTLPSQQGYLKISTFEPLPATNLADLLKAAEAKANDPVDKALEAWSNQQLYPSGHRKITFPSTKPPPYKKLVKKLDGLDSTIEEVELKDLVSTLPSAPADKVEEMIRALGDGPDLPVVFRSGEKLYIHNGESVARLQAKALLGQTRASVRLFDGDAISAARTPLDDAKEALEALGVKTVKVITGDDEEVLRALEWTKARIEATGVVPKEVWVARGSGGTVTANGELIIATEIIDIDAVDVLTALSQSSLTGTTPTDVLRLKSTVARVSLDPVENVEAGLLRTKFDVSTKGSGDLLREWGENRYDLFSVRAFENWQIEDALEEAIILYRRGEYRLGSLPQKIEKQFLADAEKIIGTKKTLPAYSDSENFLFHQTGTQGGSNPGGTYLGRDGVSRYVKFYDNEERGIVENIANALYRANGIAVPDSVVFDNGAKKAFATTILKDGRTLQALGGVGQADIAVLQDAFDGYVLDAFLANWDVVGLSADNMMLAGGKVYRIDNGGTFIFRTQGGDKPDSLLLQFEEFFSLGSTSSKGHTGQFKPILNRLGYPSVENAVGELEKQTKKLLQTLDGIATTETKWVTYFEQTSPGLSAATKERMAKMMIARRSLLADKEAKFAKDAIEAAKISKARAALRAKGKKPLTKTAFDKIVKSKEANWAFSGRSTSEYDDWLSRSGSDQAFLRMSEDAKAAAKSYSSGSYDEIFNRPQRAHRKTGTPIPPDKKKLIEALEDAIAANTRGIDGDILISRKLSGTSTEAQWHTFTDKHVGVVIGDSAFQSTAMHPDVWDGTVQLRITLRKGERRFIPPGRRAANGNHGSEVELILGNDILFIVKKVRNEHGIVILEVEAIPEGYTIPKGMTILYSVAEVFARRKEPEPYYPPEPIKVGGTVHDSGLIESVDDLAVSLCANCSRKIAGAATCDAFREGIPLAILFGLADHRENLRGDLGLAYDPIDPDEEMLTV